MAENEDDKARADAEAPSWAKAIADSVSALTARMDSMEKARADAATEKEAVEAAEDAGDKEKTEEEKALKVAEKAKADADCAAADKAKADAEKAKADAEKEDRDTAYADMQRQLADLRRQLPRDLTDEERNQIASAQAKADSVCAALGKSVPHPMLGETAGAYRRRVASILQPHSERWKGKNLKAIPDDAFETVEGQIYADAQTASRTPADIAPYELRARHRTTSAGHRVTEYVGSPRAWMEDFMPPIKQVANIRTFAHNKGN